MFVTLFADWVADTLYRVQRTETLNKLVTQAPGMLYQYRLWPDGHSSFPYTSPGIKEIYGIDAEEAAIDANKAIARVHPDDLPGVLKSIEESAQALSQWQLRYRVRLDTGGWSWVEGLAQPEALPDDSILWHGYITNVDERQRIDEMKNQFISTVSHTLRTPLTSISGSLGLILGGAHPVAMLLGVATAGNVLGAVVNWALGRALARFADRRWFPFTPTQLERASARYRRWGYWSLFGSWLPIVGDPLTLVAGVAREPLWRFLLIVTLAKGGRYPALALVG